MDAGASSLIGMRTWLENNPGVCLAFIASLTALAGLIEMSARHRRKRWLRQLASQWRMTYSSCDRLRIASRISNQLPVPGAADVSVTDVIYGSHGDAYQYVFTVEYTLGVIKGRHRQVRVARFSEPRGREPSARSLRLDFAPQELPLIEQYRSLRPAEIARQ